LGGDEYEGGEIEDIIRENREKGEEIRRSGISQPGEQVTRGSVTVQATYFT
jgi:hypothetical protein